MPKVVSQLGGISSALPTFTVLTDTSISDLQTRIMNNEAWAAIYVNAGASANMMNVINSGCPLSTTLAYNPNTAMGLIVNEGRSVNAASKVTGFLQTTLLIFSNYISSVIMQSQLFTPTQIAACLTNSATINDNPGSPGAGGRYLTSVINYQVTNLSPTYQAPVMNTAFGVGNILIAVFASLYVVMAVMKGIGPLEDWSTHNRMLFRFVVCFIYAIGLAGVFATICVGLIKSGSGNILLSGNQWGQLFAIQLTHACIWIYGNMALAIAVTPDILGIPFAFFLIR